MSKMIWLKNQYATEVMEDLTTTYTKNSLIDVPANNYFQTTEKMQYSFVRSTYIRFRTLRMKDSKCTVFWALEVHFVAIIKTLSVK